MIEISPMPVASPTPAARREAICEFYRTVGPDGRPSWSGASAAIHFGLEGEGPFDLEESLRQTNRELARRAAITPGTRVLDAGCGVGGSSSWLASECGAIVTGITLVPEQVAEARRLARLAEITGVRFIEGDYMQTGLPEASFDVVWNLESVCHCHDPRAYLDHAYALLDDDGRFACIDVFGGSGDHDAMEPMRRGCAFGALVPPHELARMLEAAGFVDVEVVDLRERVSKSVERLRDSAQQAWNREHLTQVLLGRDTRPQQRHAAASIECAQSLLSGALTYAYVGGRRPPRAASRARG